jgi:hypothetical protein
MLTFSSSFLNITNSLHNFNLLICLTNVEDLAVDAAASAVNAAGVADVEIAAGAVDAEEAVMAMERVSGSP